MEPPRFLAGTRRWPAALVAALALGQALVAVLFAQAIDRLLSGDAWLAFSPALIAAILAVMAGVAVLAERTVGEQLAQSFVTDCRMALFRAVTDHAGEGRDARWLTGLVNDMAALRNYALRGTVRLWTSALSGMAAGLWVLLTMADQRAALMALALGVLALAALVRPLSRAIRRQRSERGKLNRFLIRRVRAELSGAPSGKGHGFRKLAALSADLAGLSVQRALVAGGMDAVAVVAGLAAAGMLAWQAAQHGTAGSIAGGLTLMAFIAARLLETGRALHARIGGVIALERLAALLAEPPQSDVIAFSRSHTDA